MNFFSIAKYMLPMTRYPYSGTIIPCPVCEETSFTHVASIDRRFKRLPTVMCRHCGLLYTNTMPTEAELGVYYKKYYRFDYQLAGDKPKRKHIVKRQHEARSRVTHLEDLLAPGAKTLDFGSGSGEFVALMHENGFDAHGFEPGGAYAAHAISRLGDRVKLTRWQDADYRAEFDLVTSFHVFEHLNNPTTALERVVSWLKPGGKVYLEVPDTPLWLPRKGFGCLHFAHVIGFNQHNLTLAAAKVGLRPLKVFSSTGIGVIFERGVVEVHETLAAQGLAQARATGIKATTRSWFGHQLSKMGLRQRSDGQPVG